MRTLLSKFRPLPIGEKLFLLGMLCMAIGLPTSRFLMSLSFLLSGLGWFAIPNRWERFKNFFTWNSAAIFILCYAVLLMSLLWTDNLSYAWKDARVKMPLLFIPWMYYTRPKLSRFWFLNIIKAFILATLVSCLSACINWLKFKWGYFDQDLTDLRQISRFIDHIRLSLMIALSSLFLLFKGHEFKWGKMTQYLLIIFFLVFLVSTQYFTGLLAFFVSVLCIVLLRVKRLRKFWAVTLISLLCAGLTITSIISFREYKSVFAIAESEINENQKLSHDGNYLESFAENLEAENGYLVYWNIQKKEIEQEWNKRSSLTIYDDDLSGNKLYHTLLRFISSKGLIKDGESVRALTDKEVKSIEKGTPNVRYLEISGFSKRINQIMYQFKWYLSGGNPSGHSLTQRLEFLKAGWHIFKRNPYLGVGSGDLKDAFNDEYLKGNTRLDVEYQKRTHNQFATFFITYGIVGASLLFIIVFTAVRKSSLRTSLYFLSFALVFTISCFNEDTLETQAGVSFFAFFFSLLLYARNEKV